MLPAVTVAVAVPYSAAPVATGCSRSLQHGHANAAAGAAPGRYPVETAAARAAPYPVLNGTSGPAERRAERVMGGCDSAYCAGQRASFAGPGDSI